MNQSWHRLAAVALAICLVALVVHPTAAGAAALAAFVLLPVVFFGLVAVPRSLWPAMGLDAVFVPPVLVRTELFQRPPPIFLL